jgi:hypothetical protein
MTAMMALTTLETIKRQTAWRDQSALAASATRDQLSFVQAFKGIRDRVDWIQGAFLDF